MTTKAEIRREIRERRRQLDANWVRHTSEQIQQRLLALDEWSNARKVFCYLAVTAEVQTGTLIDACRQAGKQARVPAWRPETGRYECVRLDTGNALIPGRHGIPEPAKPAWGNPEICDLVIAPGLAFDRQGGRIGHGGGHYDRLLAQTALSRALKIGLAFAFQLRDAMPTTAHDTAMDIVVTEDAVFRQQG